MIFYLKEERQRLNTLVSCSSDQIKVLVAENTSLQSTMATIKGEKECIMSMHDKASESFARTIASMATEGSGSKRPRLDDEAERERQEGIDRYAEGLLELRDEAHAKEVAALKAEHRKEVERLRAKAAEPINEFRIAKQFHIKEAELKKEVQQTQYALETEKKKSLAMEWDVREKVYMKRDLTEMKKRCADRDQLVARIEELEAKVKRFEDRDLEGDPRLESEVELLKRVNELMVRPWDCGMGCNALTMMGCGRTNATLSSPGQ
jgi:hypothetical protein